MVKSKRNSRPLVSVVTPSYNQGEFIEDTLRSVMKQDYPHIEHLVLDGGSTDSTVKILKKYENKYGLRWVSEADEGQSDAINKGFKMAKGEIVYWLNSDDVCFDTKMISYVVERFREFKHADVIYGDGVFIDRSGSILKVVRVPDWDYNRLLRSCFIIQPAVFFRKKVALENALDKKLHFSMDYEFWLRLGRKYNFVKVDRIMTGFRIYEQAKSSANIDKLWLETKGILTEYGQDFGRAYRINNFRDKLLFGYLRLRGIRDILRLTDGQDFAFRAKVSGRLNRIKTQVALPEVLWQLAHGH